MLLRLTNRLWQLFSLFDSHSRSLPARAKTRSKKHSSFFIFMKSSFKLKDKGRCTIKSSALKLLLIELFFDISWNHISEELIGTHRVQNKLCILYGAAPNQSENVAFCYSGDDSVNPGKGGKKEHCVTMLWCYVIFQPIMNSFQRKKVVQDYPTFCLPS